MATSTNRRESWDSLSSNFASLEVSMSHDSCYGSDEISVTSNTTTPLQSSTATCAVNRKEPSLHPFLKSILKNSCTEAQDDNDTESESGYGSDEIELDYDALSEGENDEDDMSDFSIWDEASGDVPEIREDQTDFFDDSFIGFETMVRFAPSVEYINTPDIDSSDDDEGSGSQMTCHEMMLLAQKSGHSQAAGHETDVGDASEVESDGDHKEFVRATAFSHSEEFTRDGVDVDRSLFVAYMNGVHGIADTKYRAYLRNQADNIRLGHDTEPMHPDDAACMYLDLILHHVVGIFRNLLAVDELQELVALRKEDLTSAHTHDGSILASSHHQALLEKIERFLLDRLAIGRVEVCPDELSFFAGGIAHALDTHGLSAPA